MNDIDGLRAIALRAATELDAGTSEGGTLALSQVLRKIAGQGIHADPTTIDFLHMVSIDTGLVLTTVDDLSDTLNTWAQAIDLRHPSAKVVALAIHSRALDHLWNQLHRTGR